MAMSPEAKTPKPKPTYGKPEKPDTKGQIIKYGFIILALIAMIWMIATNARQKNLVCNSGGTTSLIGFGSCTEE